MSKISIQKVTEPAARATSVGRKLEAFGEKIRARAYDLFRRRKVAASPLEDWLEAEREIMAFPEAELMDADGKYEISVAAPGFKPAEIEITAFPDAIVVCAESAHRHEENEKDVCFREFGQKNLFREFEMPGPIDLDKVSAHLNDGILKIAAPKAAAQIQERVNPKVRAMHTAA